MAQSFRFDGRKVEYQEGDTIGSALWRDGTKVIGRSMKYHRPRGINCNTGSCAQCFVAVDGTPNVPACMQSASEARDVRSQNRVGTAKRDALAVVDLVYPDGFEPHQAFTRPGLVNRFFVRAVRFMSGWGKAPRLGTGTDDTPRRYTRTVQHLIIGGGQQGLTEAKRLAGPNADVLLVEEMPSLGGSAAWNPQDEATRAMAEAAPIWQGVDVWTNALAFGIYNDVVAVRRGKDLWEIRAEHIMIAPGRHDGAALFPGNDRPGILSLRGAQRLLAQGVLPGERIAVHGEPLPESFVDALAAMGGVVVTTGNVEEAVGTPVRKVRVGRAWVSCDVVVCNVPGIHRTELFQQAGCKLTFDGSLRPATDASGQTSRPDIVARLGGAA